MSHVPNRRAGLATTVVLGVALIGVTAVWLLSAYWSFAEQTRAAHSSGFAHPSVLPWMLDGLAFALALTALAAALDGRAAVVARLGALAALAASAYVNVRGVYIRTDGAASLDAVQLAAIAPVSAYLAFEVILGAIRRQVLRWRGQPAPAPMPVPRPVRLLLSPLAEPAAWRRHVLAVTAPGAQVGTDSGAGRSLPAPAPSTEVVPYIDSDRPAQQSVTGSEVVTHPGSDHRVQRLVTDSRVVTHSGSGHVLVDSQVGTDPGSGHALAGRPEPEDSKRALILAALDATAGDVPAAHRQLTAAGVSTVREYVYRVKRQRWADPRGRVAAV